MRNDNSHIHVGTGYALGSDTLCVTLFRKRQVKKTGIIKYDPIGYFSNYEQAFHKLVDFDLQTGEQDIARMIDRVVQLKKEITEAINNLVHIAS